MPTVPQSNIVPLRPQAQIDPTYLLMAAADMHANDRLFEKPDVDIKLTDEVDPDDPDGMHAQNDALSAADTQRRNSYKMLEDRRKGR